ncbi:hypothetical protein C8R46DRAFT_935316 [Mycena filopes]|nr:hypothetical protein C8R46DRAFT_935316 [Mycena filopes]
MAAALRDIAETTLAVVSTGKLRVNGAIYDLRGHVTQSTQQTAYYAPDSLLSTWDSSSRDTGSGDPHIDILNASTLSAARSAATVNNCKPPIGILNFASADQPGGGFINGASAQEESIARSSTLYASLMTPTAQQFYTLHSADPRNGFYTHAMVYSPRVVVFRSDDGAWVTPMEVDVLTSPAVHAGLVRRKTEGDSEAEITRVMRERMARILFLFERRQVRNLILGSFGTGVFQNDIDTVAAIWAELLCGPDARFRHAFQYVAFAVIDDASYVKFKRAFERARDAD